MIARAPSAVKPLPVVLPPVSEEVLSSWVGRHGAFYRVSLIQMLRHCLPEARSLGALDRTLTPNDAEVLAFLFHRKPAEIRQMTHADLPAIVRRRLITGEPNYVCHLCAAGWHPNTRGAVTKGSLQGWRITCSVCGGRLPSPREYNELGKLFAHLWPEAPRGERLLDNYIVRGRWTWISPLALLRLLLVRRPCLPARGSGIIEQGRVVDLVIPGFDRTVQEHGIELPRGDRLTLPLGIRVAVLAAIAEVEQEGPAALQRLRSGTIGHYRLGFDSIMGEAEAENQRRTTVSQLLQN